MSLTQTVVTATPFPNGEPDIQRTSFSTDVMGRFVCNTLSEATTNTDFDVVVIGSGMYGAYCAAKTYRDSRALGGKPLRILVLEAGSFLIHEHGQNIPDLGLSNPFRPVINTFSSEADQRSQLARHLVWGLGWKGNVGFPGTAYCVGGKSLYWGGWCPRLRESDLAQWPPELKSYLLDPPKFPSSFPNRLSSPGQNSVYEEVEFEIGVKPPDDFVFDPIAGPNEAAGAIGLNEALGHRLKVALGTLRAGQGIPLEDPEPPPIAVQTQSFVSGVFSPDKFSSLTMLISALRNARGQPDSVAGLFLIPNAHVSRLVVPSISKDGAKTEGYGITGIDFFAEGRRQFLSIKPTCTVVLALGCIESTRLALESFPTASHRDDADELMGRNLMAHLRFDFQFSIDRQNFRNWVQQNMGKQLRDELQTASFHLQADTPDGRFHLQVYATGDSTGNPEGLLYRMIPDAEVARRLASTQDPSRINLVFRACGEMKGNRQAKVHDLGTNWIDLASPIDRDRTFDHARAFVHYEDQTNAAIWKRMRDACIALSQEISALNTPPEDRHEVGSTWHDSGTLFMGTDPDQSVTDVSGHFHHVTNAVCVDQALFPTVGSANPVLTGLCLARKVSETIVKRFITEPDLSAADVTREEGEGFEFMLKGPNVAKWKPNNSRFTANGKNPIIENGTIVEMHGEAGLGVLFYDAPNLFKDFELRLQWKAFLESGSGDITANSGIFLRAPAPPAELTDGNFYDHAIEIQIDDTGYDFARRRFRSPLHRTGAIYKTAPARVCVQKIPATDGTAGFWNSFRIIAVGSRVRVELNGALVSEGDVAPALTGPGRIAFQYHTGKVQFRSIRLKRL